MVQALFIHQNFPGQYRHLAPVIAARPGARVIGLGQRDILPLPQANHPGTRTRGDHRRQMAVLAGEILVDEQRLNQAITP